MTRSTLRFARLVFPVMFSAVVLAQASYATVSLVASTDTLPLSTLVRTPYVGSFACYNNGTESVANVNCTVSGLPTWATVGVCSPTVPVASLPPPIPGFMLFGATITCSVTGTPTSPGSFNITITASGTGITNTVQASLLVFAVPTELSATVDLPAAKIGQRWSGSYTCNSVGTIAPANRTCTATGLPPWVTRQCFPSSGNFVLCTLFGTPTASGSSQVTVNTTASNASSVSATSVLLVSELEVPTLSLQILAALFLTLAFVGYRAARVPPR